MIIYWYRLESIGLMDEWIFSLAKKLKGVIFAGAYGGLYIVICKTCLTGIEILHWKNSLGKRYLMITL